MDEKSPGTIYELWEKMAAWPFPVANLALGFLAGLILLYIIRRSLAFSIRKAKSKDVWYFRKRCGRTLGFVLPVLGIKGALGYARETEWTQALNHIFEVLLILSVTFLLIRSVYVVQDILLDRYNVNKADNRRERKLITQIIFLRKVFIVLLVVIGLAVLMLSFEAGRKYGQTLLTSAGVASIILGFAAQKSIANFLAGIQIAFTQPIKIDDAVVVEGEWGWIEEINLTYVVVRIWDWRRLVLPITYFVEKPFQNWTRNKGEIIGSVFLYLDYRTPIDALRKKLAEVLEEEPLWDRKVQVLQVVDTHEYTIKIRALMSAQTSPEAWDLRCNVREKLINFLRETYPESLPKQRIELKEEKGA